MPCHLVPSDFCRLAGLDSALAMVAACATGSTDPRMRTSLYCERKRYAYSHSRDLRHLYGWSGGVGKTAGLSSHRLRCQRLSPMSTQLEQQGIELTEGYNPSQLDPAPALVVIGNAMSRGNPCVEYVLDRNLPYISGPSGCWSTCCRIAGYWPSRAPMARPPPPACWPGYWNMPNSSPVSSSVVCPATSRFPPVWAPPLLRHRGRRV